MIILIKKIFNYQIIIGYLILLLVGVSLILPAQSDSFSYFEQENNQSLFEFQTQELEKDTKADPEAILKNLFDKQQFAYDQNQLSSFQNTLTSKFNFYSWSQAP